MAELVREGGDVAQVAAGVHEQEGHLIGVEVGLEGHLRLQRAVLQVAEAVLDHELISVQHLVAHAAHAVAQDLLQPAGVHAAPVHKIVETGVVCLLVQGDDVGLDILQIGVGLLGGIVPAEAVVEGQRLIAVIAGHDGLLLAVADHLDVNIGQLGVILLVVALQQIQIGIAAVLLQGGEVIHLGAVGKDDGGAGHQGAVLGDEVALLLHQGYHLVAVKGVGIIGVLLGKARPEVLLFQLQGHVGHAAAEVQLLHQLAELGAGLVQQGVLVGVIFIRHILAGADEGDGIHGVEDVVIIFAGVQQGLERLEIRAGVQCLAHRVDMRAQIVQIRALIGHLVKGHQIPHAFALTGGLHMGLGRGLGRRLGCGLRRRRGDRTFRTCGRLAGILCAAGKQRQAQQQRQKQGQGSFHGCSSVYFYSDNSVYHKIPQMKRACKAKSFFLYCKAERTV